MKYRILFVISLFSILMISSVAYSASPFNILEFTITPSLSASEGQDLQLTLLGSVEDDTLGVLTAEAIVVFLMPRSFSFTNNPRLWSTHRNDWSNYLVQVNDGPVIDVYNSTINKLLSVPLYKEKLEQLESEGYYYSWIGVSKIRETLAPGDNIRLIGTIETGGVASSLEVYAFIGATGSNIDPEDTNALRNFAGASKLSVINPATDQIIGSGNSGLSVGFSGGIAESKKTGKIFPSSYGNLSQLDPMFGNLVATNLISIFTSTGSFEKTIYIPHLASEGVYRNDYTVVGVTWASNLGTGGGGRLYGAMESPRPWFSPGDDYADLWIYNEDGTSVEVVNLPHEGEDDIQGWAGELLSNNRFFIMATAEGTTQNKIYGIGGNQHRIIIITDHQTNPTTWEVIDIPYNASTIALLGGGYYAIPAENYVFIFDSSNQPIATVECEATNLNCEPTFALVDHDNQKLYVAQSFVTAGNHIWQIDFSTPSSATLEAKYVPSDIGGSAPLIGFFSLGDTTSGKRLYVPLIPQGFDPRKVAIINTNPFQQIGAITDTELTLPITTAFCGGKLYVADLGFVPQDLGLLLIGPPEDFDQVVKIYRPSGSNYNSLSYVTERTVCEGPMLLNPGSDKVIVASFPIPGAIFDLEGQTDFDFTFTASPEIENVLINGGSVESGDYISNNPVLTADLNDNSGVWTAEVWVDGTLRNDAEFTPILPSNTYLGPVQLQLDIGTLSTTFTHSITIEISDGEGIDKWEVFDLEASPGGSLDIMGKYPLAYPAVFKPKTGSADESTLRIAYELTIDAGIQVLISDITGRPVFSRKFGAATNGGRAGYNEVLWNGRSDTGGIVGNGIYPYKILDRKNKILGTGKIVVFD